MFVVNLLLFLICCLAFPVVRSEWLVSWFRDLFSVCLLFSIYSDCFIRFIFVGTFVSGVSLGFLVYFFVIVSDLCNRVCCFPQFVSMLLESSFPFKQLFWRVLVCCILIRAC